MQHIVLDTNVLSELMRPEPDTTVMRWFAATIDTLYFTTVITKAEIMLGIALLPAGKRRDNLSATAEIMFNEDFSGRVLPFDESSVSHYAAIASARRRAGFQTTTEDALISAITLTHGFALATRNTKDFMHIDNLLLINPWTTK